MEDRIRKPTNNLKQELQSEIWRKDVHEREYGAWFATRALNLDTSKEM